MEERESPSVSPPPPFNISADKTLSSGGEMTFTGGSGDPAGKKKRGRPRKYDADGNLNPAYKPPPPRTEAAQGAGFGSGALPVEFRGPKKGRGKHAGSGNWQMLAGLDESFANSARGDFTPHVVTVHTGEDVAAKVISFTQTGPGGVCVLSANGTVSNVTIRQPGSSGGLLTYEGRFEILSLKGSFAVSENGGMKCRTGGLSVSLASSDGRVIGGGLAGLLVAASPIQMVVASFSQSGFIKTQKKKHYYEPRATLTPANAETVIRATPVSEAAPNISNFPVPVTDVHMQSYGEAQNNNDEAHNNDNNNSVSDKQNHNTSSDSGDWNMSDPNSGHMQYPDINISLLVD